MSFKKYPKIETLGSEDNLDLLAFGDDWITVEEKVDGGNGSFFIDAKTGQLHECSKNRDLTEEGDEKTFIKYRQELRELLKDKKINPDYIYYIEWMATHTINYTNVPLFLGLDIRPKHSANIEGPGLFIGRESKEQEFKRIGIETVPLIWAGKATELKKLTISDLVPNSKYYKGPAEGIVIKNYSRKATVGNHQLMGKIVRDEFKECNKAVFGGIKQKVSDTARIVDEFITDARIKKMINKLINEENQKMGKELMHQLPKLVIKDMLVEEASNIVDKYKFLDFREMKQKVSKRCYNVLTHFMAERGGKNGRINNL